MASKSQWKPGHVPWNKGKKSHMRQCSKCGTFLSDKVKHACKSVEAKGPRFCEDCGRKLNNKNWERYSRTCGSCNKKKLRERERQQRSELVKQFGGKCKICGYSRCEACLEFHHKNRKDKDESSKGTLLKKIKKHPKKFDLLCNRCHREVELGIIKEGKNGRTYVSR
jgi:hypothetical protein